MMLTCLKCGQAWHVSAKTKYKANNYICPKCERKALPKQSQKNK